jgi:PiT family inorganic phosphate transporter
MVVWLVIGLIAFLGLYTAWTIGANDVANSMADAVGSKAVTIKRAVILAAIFEFAGAFLVGSHVTDTVRKGIVDPAALSSSPEAFALGMAGSLLATALWLHVASSFGMPVSTTHSIVGAVAGFGLVAAGAAAVQWGTLGTIVASWVISPLAGMAVAYLTFKLILWTILRRSQPIAAAAKGGPVCVFVVAVVVVLATLYKGLKNLLASGTLLLTGWGAFALAGLVGLVAALVARLVMVRLARGTEGLPLAEQLRRVERLFAPLVIVTSCTVAFAHGANDVANSIGPVAAVFGVLKTGTVTPKVHVPPWILALGGIGIVLGLATYGYIVMRTVGTKLTELTPSRGVAADIAAASTVLACSRLGLPVSTTHTIVGAIIGVGLARGIGAVNKKVANRIFGSWLITVPAVALLSITFFLLGRALGADVLLRKVMESAATGGTP